MIYKRDSVYVTGRNFLRQRGVKEDENGSISVQNIVNAGLSAVVACNQCGATHCITETFIIRRSFLNRMYCKKCMQNILDEIAKVFKEEV